MMCGQMRRASRGGGEGYQVVLTASRAVGVARSPLHRFGVDTIVLQAIDFIGAAANMGAHDATAAAVVRADGAGVSVDVAV